MYHVSNQTLAKAKAFVGIKPMDMGHIELPVVTHSIVDYRRALKEYEGETELISVEVEAIKFYLHNHAFALLCAKRDTHEHLTVPEQTIALNYPIILSAIGRRLVSYTLLVITREARHLSSTSAFSSKIAKRYGTEFRNWRMHIPSSSEGAVKYLLDTPINMPVGKYCEALTYVFNKGKFSGGYGGKPWGNIANTLEKYFKGVISLEAFIDTAWTLAHNNGPMFNKGLLYDSYGQDLTKILDVQASGQIPFLVNDVVNGDYKLAKVTKEAVHGHQLAVHAALPELAEGYVNWHMVEELSWNGCTYASMKHLQHTKHGLPPAHQAAIDAEQAALKAEEESKFYVAPGVFAKKLNRAA